MDDEWGSDDGVDQGLGDISAIPEVELPDPIPDPNPPKAKQEALAIPARNAWEKKSGSGDFRHLMREPPASAPAVVRGQGRRDAFNSFANKDQDHGMGGPRKNYRSAPNGGPSGSLDGFGGGGGGRGTVLYVSNLPFETNENEISSFFQTACDVSDVRLSYHSDTGNIKAAFVTLLQGQPADPALSLDGRLFGGRSLHVKIEGSDRRNRERGSYGSGGYGANGSGTGGSYGSPYGGSSFSSRDRRSSSGGGGWGGSGGSYEAPSSSRTDRDQPGENRGAGRQNDDPTIPTGPTPAGRRKLQLKPRTKPPPTLEIDHRAIDGVKKSEPASAPPVLRDGTRQGDQSRAVEVGEYTHRFQKLSEPGNINRRPNSAGFEKVMGKDAAFKTSQHRLSSSRIAQEKSDEASKPTVHNAFAVLDEEEDDS